MKETHIIDHTKRNIKEKIIWKK